MNYVYGIPRFGVSTAAEIYGEVVVVVVNDVGSGVVYDAVLGGGARGSGTVLHCRTATDLTLAMVGTGFSYSAQERAVQASVRTAVLPRVRDIRRSGAAALDLCAVGAGRFDAFYETGLKPWDSAAGLLVAAEAGARTTRFPSTIGEVVLAAAPGVFALLLELLLEQHATVTALP